MKKIFIANWKMQLDIKESGALAKNYARSFKTSKDEIVLAPDFSSLSLVSTSIKKSAVKLAAQDVAAYDQGAYTGEVSAKSLKQLGVKYVLVGHSERRIYLKENGELIKLKIEQALKNNLIPVLCIGESLKERKAKKTNQILHKQLEEALAGLKISDDKSIIVAYEPIWAIGSGQAMSPSEAEGAHVFIKVALAEIIGQIPRVIYGGSVNAKNASEFLEWPNVDGLLVGGASLKLDEFSKIVKVK
jgi:triosephosphate isomerase